MVIATRIGAAQQVAALRAAHTSPLAALRHA
jgi:hypothetical protein